MVLTQKHCCEAWSFLIVYVIIMFEGGDEDAEKSPSVERTSFIGHAY